MQNKSSEHAECVLSWIQTIRWYLGRQVIYCCYGYVLNHFIKWVPPIMIMIGHIPTSIKNFIGFTVTLELFGDVSGEYIIIGQY